MKHPLKAQGFVRTPPFIAALLARWALRAPTDYVLDAGFGEGIFLLESTRRLLALGASMQHLAAQLHGVDLHPDAVQGMQRALRIIYCGPFASGACSAFNRKFFLTYWYARWLLLMATHRN